MLLMPPDCYWPMDAGDQECSLKLFLLLRAIQVIVQCLP